MRTCVIAEVGCTRFDAEGYAMAGGRRLRHVVRVTGVGTPHKLCQDGRPPGLGVLQALQHQDTCDAGATSRLPCLQMLEVCNLRYFSVHDKSLELNH